MGTARIVLIAVAFLACAQAQEAVVLNNTALYETDLAVIQSEKPHSTDQLALHTWLAKLSHTYMRLRRYDAMEVVCKAMLAIAPNYPADHANLSVAYGKQGKYVAAIEEAKIAALLSGSDNIHPELVLCSWLYLSGKKTEALDLFSTIHVPTDHDQRGIYFACTSCLYASMGTIPPLQEAIMQTLKEAPDERSFFERDMAFDPYRDQKWFIDLIGQTLATK